MITNHTESEPDGDGLEFDFSITPEIQSAYESAIDSSRTTLQKLMLTAFRRDYGIDTAGADGLTGSALDVWLFETESAWIHQQLAELRLMREGGAHDANPKT